MSKLLCQCGWSRANTRAAKSLCVCSQLRSIDSRDNRRHNRNALSVNGWSTHFFPVFRFCFSSSHCNDRDNCEEKEKNIEKIRQRNIQQQIVIICRWLMIRNGLTKSSIDSRLNRKLISLHCVSPNGILLWPVDVSQLSIDAHFLSKKFENFSIRRKRKYREKKPFRSWTDFLFLWLLSLSIRIDDSTNSLPTPSSRSALSTSFFLRMNNRNRNPFHLMINISNEITRTLISL